MKHRAPRKNEFCTYVKLRRLGYRYQEIASLFRRSTSFIQRNVLKVLKRLGVKPQDYRRKIGDAKKKILKPIRMGNLRKIIFEWIRFANGERAKPP